MAASGRELRGARGAACEGRVSPMSRREVSHLRLVTREQTISFSTPTSQGDLFLEANVNTLVFVYTPGLGETFGTLLIKIRPRWVFDLRPAPRFEILGQSRKDTFALFENLKIQYIDVTGMLGVNTYKTTEMNAIFLAKTIAAAGVMGERTLKGPNVFLLDDLDYLGHIINLLPAYLQPPARKRWEIVQITQPYRQ